jgi:hypothetical protein
MAASVASRTRKKGETTGPGASASIGSKRSDEPIDEDADARWKLSVAGIEQRDRRRRGRIVGQDSNQCSPLQIAFDVVARHLDQPQTEPAGGDETFRPVDRHRGREMDVAHDRRPPPKPNVLKPIDSRATLPARIIMSDQEIFRPYFCLIGHSSRRALSRLALSGQLLTGAKRC